MEIEYILFILVLFFGTYASSIHMSYVALLYIYIQPGQPLGVHQKKKKKTTILSRGTIPCAMTEKLYPKILHPKSPSPNVTLIVIDLQITTYEPSYDSCMIKAKIRGQTTMHSLHLGTSPPPPTHPWLFTHRRARMNVTMNFKHMYKTCMIFLGVVWGHIHHHDFSSVKEQAFCSLNSFFWRALVITFKGLWM